MEGNEEMKECVIIGAGDVNAEKLSEFKKIFIIAADGGYVNLIRMHKTPDVLIGDFDSLLEAGISEEMLPMNQFEICRLPCEKDETDILAAIKHGMKLGYNKFHIFGGTGDRIDHIFANIQCLTFLANHGCEALLYGMDFEACVLKDSVMKFKEETQGTVSIFCLGETAQGVTLEGLKYPLNDVVLNYDDPIGVSNEFIGKKSSIQVKKGLLLIIRYYSKKM